MNDHAQIGVFLVMVAALGFALFHKMHWEKTPQRLIDISGEPNRSLRNRFGAGIFSVLYLLGTYAAFSKGTPARFWILFGLFPVLCLSLTVFLSPKANEKILLPVFRLALFAFGLLIVITSFFALLNAGMTGELRMFSLRSSRRYSSYAISATKEPGLFWIYVVGVAGLLAVFVSLLREGFVNWIRFRKQGSRDSASRG